MYVKFQWIMNHIRSFENLNKKWWNHCFSWPSAMNLPGCAATSFKEERLWKKSVLSTRSTIFYCRIFAATLCLTCDPATEGEALK